MFLFTPEFNESSGSSNNKSASLVSRIDHNNPINLNVPSEIWSSRNFAARGLQFLKRASK